MIGLRGSGSAMIPMKGLERHDANRTQSKRRGVPSFYIPTGGSPAVGDENVKNGTE